MQEQYESDISLEESKIEFNNENDQSKFSETINFDDPIKQENNYEQN